MDNFSSIDRIYAINNVEMYMLMILQTRFTYITFTIEMNTKSAISVYILVV